LEEENERCPLPSGAGFYFLEYKTLLAQEILADKSTAAFPINSLKKTSELFVDSGVHQLADGSLGQQAV
jgi:hypothetical protein